MRSLAAEAKYPEEQFIADSRGYHPHPSGLGARGVGA